MIARPSAAASKPSPHHEAQTRSGRAFELIRSDIIRGRLGPDERLRLENLSERYSTGFSPIREALMRLQSEGLVVQEQMKGFRVSPVSLEHLHDISKVRIEMESLGLKWAIEHGDVAWEANILGAFHRLSNQSKTGPGSAPVINEGWNGEHRTFHRALVAACESQMLISVCEALFDQAERYVALSIQYLAKGRDDVGEHRELMQATLNRDIEAASRLCRAHIERTTAKVVESFGLIEDRDNGKKIT